MLAPPDRLPFVDTLRGCAILAMIAYHLVWDLVSLRLVDLDLFDDPLWLAARTAILCSFLLLAGAGLVLAGERGTGWPRVLRRLGLLAAAAAGVSTVSFVVFPDSPIFFGVLHHLALASLLGLAFRRLPLSVVAAAALAVAVLGETAGAALFDRPALLWVGLGTRDPSSNDYVSLFPWFAAVLAGIALARLPAVRVQLGRLGGVAPLAWAGRNSLAIYLTHQPVLYGALWLVASQLAPSPAVPAGDAKGEVGAFLEQCVSSCVGGGQTQARCAQACRCVADGWRREGLWSDAIAQRLAPSDRGRAEAVLRSCL